MFPALRTATLASLLATACQGPPRHHAEDPAPPPPHARIDAAPAPMLGFSWVVDGRLAAMPLPGRSRAIARDIAFLHQQGVGVLVSLTVEPPAREALANAGIVTVHLPVEDFTAPNPTQLAEFSRVLREADAAGVRVGVHCLAGLGRTGTLSAVALVDRGMTAEAAMAEVRRLRPGSIETEAQEQAVRDYAAASD